MARARLRHIMRTHESVNFRHLAPLAAAALFLVLPVGRAQAAETITASAQVKGAGGAAASAPVTVTVDRFSTDADRDEVMATLKKGGTTAVRDLLAKKSALGSVKVGNSTTPIKYVYARTTGDGRLITAVTGAPIAFVGAGLPNAPAKTGFDLGLVMLEVGKAGSGKGELVPATKVKVDAQGAIVTEDYSGEVVHLSNVAGK
jgi:hypothetical protein